MKKGQICEGIVERVEFPDRGIVHVGDVVCAVKNTLPGQKIRFRLSKVHKGKADAVLLEVLERSPLESEQTCSHFGFCGGCVYLSMPYEEQLDLKESQVKKLLDDALRGQHHDWCFEGIKASPRKYEYRNKMEFTFGDASKGGELSLGMHVRGSFYDVVTVDDCRLVDEDYRLILGSVREFFAVRKVTFFHRVSHLGYLRHLLIRKASKTGEILIGLVTTSQDPWDNTGSDEECADMTAGSEDTLILDFCDMLLHLESEGRLSGRIQGILHILNDSVADVVKSDRTDILYGKDSFEEELLGLHFRISAFSFFQTNSYSAEVLYSTVREYINDAIDIGISGRKPIVFDLYSGTGTIAQLIAPVADKVIGIEIVEEAVDAARENAMRNGLNNCTFIVGDVLKVLGEVNEKPDFIVMDPPREGIVPKTLKKILSYKVPGIVYISCKPTSLARDLEEFISQGYLVEKAVAVDQFPWTANCEVVCLLSREKNFP